MKKHRKLNKTKTFNPMLLVGFVLVFFLLSISVGFSALSTSLSINGHASFKPVGLIRIMSLKQNTLFNATETSKTFTQNTVSITGTLENFDSRLVYDVNIANLGETDKVLTDVVKEVFSNDECDYELIGLQIDDIIKAHESLDFQVVLKYKNTVTIPLDTHINAKLKFVFEDYEEYEDKAYFMAYNGEESLFGFTQTNITSFSRNTSLTKQEVLAKEGVKLISNQSTDKYNSKYEIYGWVENNKIYWWSDATIVYFHPETLKAFKDAGSIVTVDLTGTSTEKVENFAHWFDKCRKLTTITGQIDTSGLKLQYNPSFNYATDSNENTASGYGLSFMFNDCNALTAVDLTLFDTTNASDMKRMFGGCKKLQALDLSGFDTSNVKSMYWMFRNNEQLTELDLSSFDTSNVESMFGMFVNATRVKSIKFGEEFNTSNVKNMGNMFSGDTSLTTIYAKADFIRRSDLNSSNMFNNTTKLVGGKGTEYETVYNSSYKDKRYAQIATPSQSGYFTLYGGVIKNTITYNLDGGVANNPILYDAETETFTLNNPLKPGYTFIGWTGSNGSTPQVTVQVVKGTTGNLVYNANYQINTYTVVFDANGGTGTMANQVFAYDEYKNLSENAYTNGNLSFLSWNTEPDGTGMTIKNKKVVGNLLPTGTITLYAQWEKDTDDIQLIFSLPGPCHFNGSANTITGTNCAAYSNETYIDTDFKLFSTTHKNKDFIITFDIDRYVPAEQEVEQATIMNSLTETKATNNPGFVLRKTKNNTIELIVRDGITTTGTTTFTNLTSFTLVKKNNKVCYSANNGPLKYIYDYSGYAESFDVPLTFGSSLDKTGTTWRNIKGTLSNILVKVGRLDDSIQCDSSMR